MLDNRTYIFLLLEDSESDVFLLRRHLSKVVPNLDLRVAGSREQYEYMLQEFSPDLILSDYRLPQYSGIEALMFARHHAPTIPFVFVTGALQNESLARETILKGASGFVLKNNLAKLERIIPGLLQNPAQTNLTTRETATTHEPLQRGDYFEDLIQQLSVANPEKLAEISRLLRE